MGQFKPMVKMMTTEPSVELKLKKGGKVEKKMQMGGDPNAAPGAMAAPAMRTMGAPAGRPPVVKPGPDVGPAPGMPPKKPSMMERLKAMRAKMMAGRPSGPVGGAGRPMKEGGESKAEHAAEMKKMAKTSEALKKHADKPASKAHKGLKTGGVVNGQGGYKSGGIINTEGQGGKYRNTKMDTAHSDRSPAKSGEVKMGNAGGYKKGGAACYATGGVAKGNAGGYKKGGKAKKFADGGMSGYAPVSDFESQLMPEEEDFYLEEEMESPKSQGAVTEIEREVVRAKPVRGKELGKMYGPSLRKLMESMKGEKPAKKYAAGGAVNDSGKAEKMPQGSKRPSTPVSINQLSGTYKKGGKVKK